MVKIPAGATVSEVFGVGGDNGAAGEAVVTVELSAVSLHGRSERPDDDDGEGDISGLQLLAGGPLVLTYSPR